MKKGCGNLRQIIIRNGHSTGEILVCIVTATPILPAKRKFCEAILKAHPEITTIVHSVNKNDLLFPGEQQEILYGNGYIIDKLCDNRFIISADSFYQINPLQTENLYNKAISLAKIEKSDMVVDAYCGIGTIGITASKYAKYVMGIEINKSAVKDAIKNAKLNNIKNIKFITEDSGNFLMRAAANNEHVDVLIMDPPRAGSNIKFIDAISKIEPKKIVYISCNPETLARDLKILKKYGYSAIKAIPFDMFPNTSHIETVCLITHNR